MPATMTVGELIKLLSACDENATVCLCAGNECDAYLEIVSIEKHIIAPGVEDTAYKTEKTLWTAG